MVVTVALPPPVKAARAIQRALEDLSPEERIEALAIALPPDEPALGVRLEMALEAIGIVVAGSYNSEAKVAGRIAHGALRR